MPETQIYIDTERDQLTFENDSSRNSYVVTRDMNMTSQFEGLIFRQFCYHIAMFVAF